MSDPYQEFLVAKAPRDEDSGMIEPPALPAILKPFQRAIVSWALRRGRAALFESTGLGKTIQQLSWARAIADHEKSQVLILTPLAVAEQTVEEAEKFGIDGVAYAADNTKISSDITVTNYERFEKFDISKFCGVVLDESGIIKHHEGKTRAILTEVCAGLPWRLCCTATPAPNDYTELGQHSEFLGVMRAAEMLAMFFVHDGSIRANADAGTDGWRLKRHAQKDFWAWLASWSVMIRSPADLGFDGSEYELPELRYHQVTVPAEYRHTAGMLFPVKANTLSERIGVRRDSVDARVDACLRIVAREPQESWLIWCHLNNEADAIEKRLAGSLQVRGSHATSIKVNRLLGFKNKNPLYLVSKPSIAGHGMNYQHCSRQIMVGLTDSFEELFQAVRRCWRFGQTKPVDVYMIASELEGAVVANLRRKEANFEMMLDAMSGHMRDLMKEAVLRGRNATSEYNPTIPMELPKWMIV